MVQSSIAEERLLLVLLGAGAFGAFHHGPVVKANSPMRRRIGQCTLG